MARVSRTCVSGPARTSIRANPDHAGTVLFLARLGGLPAVAPEGPGRGELAELVADHVLGHVELDEVPPVVDREVLAHELGHDRAGPGPRLDRLATAGGVGLE